MTDEKKLLDEWQSARVENKTVDGGKHPCCWKCSPDYRLMLLCATCGNKRCPHATDHDETCTNSNEPGQPGSCY